MGLLLAVAYAALATLTVGALGAFVLACGTALEDRVVEAPRDPDAGGAARPSPPAPQAAPHPVRQPTPDGRERTDRRDRTVA